ncbi:MAG: D-alanyl-D-alanine carboxypeptidase, partial [Acidobacteriota bacterium]
MAVGPRALGVLVGLLIATATLADGGFSGCALQMADASEPIVLEDGTARFVPASVTKLIVTIAALERLGPEHRVITEARTDAALEQGVLSGDLVIRGGGDPTWSRRYVPAPEPLPPA